MTAYEQWVDNSTKNPYIEPFGEGSYIALELAQDPLMGIVKVVNLDVVHGTGCNINYFLE